MKKFNFQSIIVFFSLLTALIPYAQTGAGGVGSSSTNPIWLDANSINLSNGSSVSTFLDISGNGNDFTQTSSANQPIFTSSGLNGLPVITFDGANDYMQRGATSGLDGSNITVFIVFQRANLTSQSLIDAGYSGQLDKWMVYCNSGNNRLISKHLTPATRLVYYNDAGAPSFISSHFGGTGLKTYEKGVLKATNGSPYVAEPGHNLLRIGAYNYNLTQYFLDGFLAEVIVFNTDLNNLERTMVENYLGAKYNLGIPTDRYAYESTHNIGVIGIGDDGFNTQTTAKGAGIVQVENPASMTSGEFLLSGHTNVALDQFTTTDLPISLPTHQRFTRTWRVDETGDVGTTNIVFDLSSGNNFGASSSYNLLVDSDFDVDSDFSDATVISGTYNAGAQTMTFNVDLNDGDFFTFCGIEQQLIIQSTGITNNWSQTTTWDCGCIPTLNDEVYIMPGHTVNVDIDADCKYLSLDGTLNMSSNFTLNNYGDFDITGTANFTDGTYAIVGAVDQYVDPGGLDLTFNNLIINNTGGSIVSFFESTYTLNGLLSPINGAMTLDPAPLQFIVNSTSATTGGRIGQMQSGFSSSGLFTVRRFIQAGSADWRNISSPVKGAKFAVWDADLSISCPDCPDGTACGATGCFNSIVYQHNSYTYDVLSINDIILNGRGYEVYCGDDLVSFSGTTLESVGTLNTSSDIVETVVKWTTKGNPYACPIDFDLLTFAGVGQYYYVYDASIGGYQWYDKGSGSSSDPGITGLSDGYIATGQAFWLYAGTGTVTFTQAAKIESSDATYIRSNEVDESVYFTLSENNTTYKCISNIELSQEASDDLDLMDVLHLERPDQKASSLAFVTGDEYVRKNYLLNNKEDKFLPMHLNIVTQGYYTIETSGIDQINEYKHIYIHDKLTNEIIDLKKEPQYVFFAEKGLDDSRLTFVLSNEDALDDAGSISLELIEVTSDITVTQLGSIIDIHATNIEEGNTQISLINLLGQQEVYFDITNLNEGSNIIALPQHISGVHILTITVDGKRISKKLVL